LKSPIDILTLKRAVKKSIDVVPLMCCVYKETSNRWVDSGCNVDDIVFVKKSDELPYIEKESLKPLTYESGPRLRIDVARGGSGHDSLCIVVDHMVCDGAGFKQYLYLLAALYSEISNGMDEQSITNGYPTRRDFAQVSKNLLFDRKTKIILGTSKTPKPDPKMYLPLAGNGKAWMARIALRPYEFKRAYTYAKDAKATINDMILAAYARGLYSITDCEDIVIPCPVDLRRYGKAGQSFGICNLTSNYFCKVALGQKDPFCATLASVSLQMKAQKMSNKCLKGPLLLHIASHVVSHKRLKDIFFRMANIPTISFTNLGIIDDKRLKFGSVEVSDAFISTALKRPPAFQLSVSTFKNCCTMTTSLYANDHDRQVVSSFLNKIKQDIIDSTM
jgi:NRPS condensation-like uncharacterized protein